MRVLILGRGLAAGVPDVLASLGKIETLLYVGQRGAGLAAARWADRRGLQTICLPRLGVWTLPDGESFEDWRAKLFRALTASGVLVSFPPLDGEQISPEQAQARASIDGNVIYHARERGIKTYLARERVPGAVDVLADPAA